MPKYTVSVNIPALAARRLAGSQPTVVVSDDADGLSIHVRWEVTADHSAGPHQPPATVLHSNAEGVPFGICGSSESLDIVPGPEVAKEANRWLEDRLRVWALELKAGKQ